MRNIFRIVTILIFLCVINVVYINGYNSVNAQGVWQFSSSEPNAIDKMSMLKEKIEKLEAENIKKDLQKYPQDVDKPKPVHPNEIDREKISTRQIEADNIRYKDRIFGNPFCGIAMSIKPTKDEYEIGEDIEISTLCKNFSNEKKELLRNRYVGNIEDCCYLMYYSDGTPVSKSKLIEEYEANINIPPELPRVSSEEPINLRPRQIYSFIDYKINPYLIIEREGTYSFVIMRNITGEWKDGFMISNMININIVKKKEEQN